MVIDTDDYAASGIEVFQFPGGEFHANVPKWRTSSVIVFAKVRGAYDWMALQAVGDAFDSQGVFVHLFMPYLPGARQDRNPDGLTPLTTRIYANSLYWATTVTCVDPHSQNAVDQYNDRLPTLLKVIDHSLVVEDLVSGRTYDYILVPDIGAIERAKKVADRLGVKRILNCAKVRDFASGKLSGFTVPWINPEWRGLLVDDICDGGGTFVGIADALTVQGDDVEVDLYVTHGIFSKGVALLDFYRNVFTTDSFYDDRGIDSTGKLSVASLLPYYMETLTP